MTYTELLSKWRFAPLGDPLFQDESGVYFSARMREMRTQTSDADKVAASKTVGWE
jgi:zona occludens toxin (predicted ATPase)